MEPGRPAMLGTIDRSSGRAVPEIDVLEGSVEVKNARVLSCTEGETSGNCKAGSCLDLGTLGKVCKECATTTEAPIDGTCSSTVGSNTCSNGVCTACTGTYFLFYGGCYNQASGGEGAALCSAASNGQCSERADTATGIFVKGSKDAPTGLYTCDDETNGVENCKTCTSPATNKPKCNACRTGFLPDQDKSECIQSSLQHCLLVTDADTCEDGCKTCDSSGCSECLEGHHSSSSSPVVCTKCVLPNCGSYPDSKDVCTTCLNGFQGYMDAIGPACGGEEASTSTPRRAVGLPSSGQVVGSGWMPRVSDGGLSGRLVKVDV
ncbi:High cysteine protein [Giardia muris]|uniref:High cysteine protein n=1 Tax=Giardia muris TaxID=5742 RepID=A0A4Z1T2I0_GIAMU|nr:High cysteine protein [Giardia muris]|eukprot:TNJ29858.1 High cysteine protein [Giardia muris]